MHVRFAERCLTCQGTPSAATNSKDLPRHFGLKSFDVNDNGLQGWPALGRLTTLTMDDIDSTQFWFVV